MLKQALAKIVSELKTIKYFLIISCRTNVRLEPTSLLVKQRTTLCPSSHLHPPWPPTTPPSSPTSSSPFPPSLKPSATPPGQTLSPPSRHASPPAASSLLPHQKLYPASALATTPRENRTIPRQSTPFPISIPALANRHLTQSFPTPHPRQGRRPRYAG